MLKNIAFQLMVLTVLALTFSEAAKLSTTKSDVHHMVQHKKIHKGIHSNKSPLPRSSKVPKKKQSTHAHPPPSSQHKKAAKPTASSDINHKVAHSRIEQGSSPPSPKTFNLNNTPFVSKVEAPGAANSPPASAPPPPRADHSPVLAATQQVPQGSPLPAVGASSSPSPSVAAAQAPKAENSPQLSSPVTTPEASTPKYAPPEGDFSLNMQNTYPIKQAMHSPPSIPAHAADSPPPAEGTSPSSVNRRLLARHTRK